MLLTTSWQLIASASGALVQKHGTANVVLAYHTSIPTTQDTFGLSHNEPLILPLVTGKSIYGKTVVGTVKLSVEAI